MRILIVEDTIVARTMLERTLRKLGYQVDSVSNSHDAMQLLLKEPIQFVITDWVMPGGDGPSLCREIREHHFLYYIYIILVTYMEGTESVIKGLESGANDFVRKPIQLDELHARIRAGERVLALEKALQDRNEELVKLSNNLLAAQNLINRDLQTAANMQKKLLPASASVLLNVTIDWLFCPSAMVSGDIFNFFRLDESHVGFYALDVAGHGVSSAMFTLSLSRLLSPEIQHDSPLKRRSPEHPYYEIVPTASVMAILNAQFQTTTDNWLYFTIIYGIVDTVAKTIEMSQAGHPNPIYLPMNQAARFVGDGGFPIGITEEAIYDTIVLGYMSGDRLVLYSDGITECVGMDGEMFGEQRLLTCLEQNRSLPIQEVPKAINERIRAWRGNEAYEDDISMLILEMP
jgi:sigma-B regulation protein RsbU (phosphoserine phosphatase)